MKPMATRQGRGGLAALCGVLLGAVGLVRAQDAAPAPGGDERSLPATAAEVERRYLRLVAVMGRLLGAENDPDAGGRLHAALKRARELEIDARLRGVRRLLETGKVEDALDEERWIERDLRRILRILRGEDELEALKEELEELRRLEEGLERLERLIERQEEEARSTEELLKKRRESRGPKEGEKAQRAAREAETQAREAARRQRRLGALARDLERALRNLDRRRQGGGERPQNTGAQSGERAGQRRRFEEELQELVRASRRAEEAARRLESGNIEGAREDQEETLESLRSAREALQAEQSRREEEARKNLARRLTGRLFAMLAEQKLVSEETAEIAERAPGRGALDEADAFRLRALARREENLATEADEVKRLLGEEGSSIVGPAVAERVRKDLMHIAERLDSGDAGEEVRRLQGEVEAALEELIAALDAQNRRRDGRRGASGAQGGGGAGGAGAGGRNNRDLIAPSREIRMLVALQGRIRGRTERTLDAVRAAEGAGDPETAGRLRKELEALAEAEAELGRLTRALIEKYPVIDPYLLGGENDGGSEPSTRQERAEEGEHAREDES